MKIKKNNLIILNSLYSAFALFLFSLIVITILTNSTDTSNIALVITFFVLICLTVLGLWLLLVPKATRAGLVLLRVQAILKYIFIILMCLVLMLFIFAIQDCANSLFKQNTEEIPSIGRFQASYIFIIIMVYATSYFIFYNIMLSVVKKDKPNKAIIIIYAIHNIVIILTCLVLSVYNIIKRSGFITEIVNSFIGGNIPPVVGYILTIMMLLCLLATLGMASYILLEKTFKKPSAE